MSLITLNGMLTVAVATLAFSGGGKAAGPANPAPGQWTEQKAGEWYQKQPWLVGFNFVPSTAVNDTEMWQKETFDPAVIDRELAWAEHLGYNSCRVFVQYIVWKADPEGLKNRFVQLLEIADKHKISVMPVLFDDCAFDANRDPYLGKQDDPMPGRSNARWVPSPGLKLVTDKSAWPDLERYVKDMVGTFKNDQRIVLWDLYNEPGNSGMGNTSLPLVEASFAWARQANPSQPLTIGVWGGPREISDKQIELSDIVSFHFYGDYQGMKARITDFKSHKRPVLCTEWMARTLGSKFETELPLFKEEKVGCYNWGLVNGRTQCQYPWGSPENAPEPAVWFHDLLRRDGSPKNPDEVTFIRRFTGAPGVNRLKPLFDFPVRDTCVCVGPDGYYLTGTTGSPKWWTNNDGIQIWKSKDLKTWEPLGLVWSFEKNMTAWQKPWGGGSQAVWAPELHYINSNFWISYTANGSSLLKSTSGKPEGPYVDVRKDAPLVGEIDGSLFQDDDGSVYYVWQNGKIARMNDDMTGLVGEPKLLTPANAPQVGFEGAFLFKANGRYYLSCADVTDGRYHCYVASSSNLMGPYGDRYLAVPHAGHNTFFQDKNGNWWCTFFGWHGDPPFTERPGILRIEFGLDGEPRPLTAGEDGAPSVWKPVANTLLSKFAGDVNPEAPLPEYPRPQMQRKDWKNLNGLWEYAILPTGTLSFASQGRILVPYPVESALSGVKKLVGPGNNLWYKRMFEIPENWNGKQILLHFGAVDWRAEVSVNGRAVGKHEGGFAPFAFDITSVVKEDGPQELMVKVWDPTEDGFQPHGKQANRPGGILYTAVTGIWQPVWLEPVNTSYITGIETVSDIKDKTVTVTVHAAGLTSGVATVECEDLGVTVSGIIGAPVVIKVPKAELWTPDSPKLYPITVSLGKDDLVTSYFALRKISIGKDAKDITRMMLNDSFVFQHGPLDQGYWPDGLYTAPTDAALAYDITVMKKMGFNVLRKHVKVEPARFYYHCDRLGMLVWQDMPHADSSKMSELSKANFEREWKEIIWNFKFFPSIIMWVPFNEGWGQFDTERIAALTRQLDPTRLVNNASGWDDKGCGDIIDVHKYPAPEVAMPSPEEKRAAVLGEYGSIGFLVKGHSWNDTANWAMVVVNSLDEVFKKYDETNKALRPLIEKGLSAAICACSTDIESENDGFMTYDREVIKIPVEKIQASNQALIR